MMFKINKIDFPEKFSEHYKNVKNEIRKRLNDFKNVKEEEYFYELCFCLMTPQSKAQHSFQVVEILKEKKFYEKPFNAASILADKKHYIRFHNSKALRLLNAHDIFPDVLKILKSKVQAKEKRNRLAETVLGLGLKESSHFLRNIGFRNLAILDRHILRCLTECGLFEEIPKISSNKSYWSIEEKFLAFADQIKIPVDELDLLFWSFATGKILK